MDEWRALDAFLRTDPADIGCDQALAMLQLYAQLVADGGDAEDRFPGVAAHLRACGPCADDLDGLLTAVRATSDRRATP
jgi:hypothetical protein